MNSVCSSPITPVGAATVADDDDDDTAPDDGPDDAREADDEEEDDDADTDADNGDGGCLLLGGHWTCSITYTLFVVERGGFFQVTLFFHPFLPFATQLLGRLPIFCTSNQPDLEGSLLSS